jgi:lincosamide nucleotidyltransferase
MTLPQEAMIARVAALCRDDTRVAAALTYGSFAVGEGDAFSDVEFAVFIDDEDLPGLGRRAWVAQIAPLELFFDDQVGHHTAIFADLIRGEFHFLPASEMSVVSSWQGTAYFPDLGACLLLDRDGELAAFLEPLLGGPPERRTPERALALPRDAANWILFGATVLARGEAARALEILGLTHRNLIWMARLVEHRTAHWPTPSRALEQDISPAAYARLAACSAPLEREALWGAYLAAWDWAKALSAALGAEFGEALPPALVAKLDRFLLALRQGARPPFVP